MKIVVPSCAAYSDCWSPLVQLMKVYWPDRPYPLMLVTDKVEDPWHGDEVFQSGVDAGWCMNLAYGLSSIKDDHIIMWLEDFFPTAPVRTSEISNFHQAMLILKTVCGRLYPCPGSDEDGLPFGRINPKADYLVSTQVAIWERKYLIELLKDVAGSAWDFEIKGTSLRKRADKFLAWNRAVMPWPVQYLCSGVNRGKWNPDSVALFKRHNLKVNLSRRPVDIIGTLQDNEA